MEGNRARDDSIEIPEVEEPVTENIVSETEEERPVVNLNNHDSVTEQSNSNTSSEWVKVEQEDTSVTTASTSMDQPNEKTCSTTLNDEKFDSITDKNNKTTIKDQLPPSYISSTTQSSSTSTNNISEKEKSE